MRVFFGLYLFSFCTALLSGYDSFQIISSPDQDMVTKFGSTLSVSGPWLIVGSPGNHMRYVFKKDVFWMEFGNMSSSAEKMTSCENYAIGTQSDWPYDFTYGWNYDGSDWVVAPGVHYAGLPSSNITNVFCTKNGSSNGPNVFFTLKRETHNSVAYKSIQDLSFNDNDTWSEEIKGPENGSFFGSCLHVDEASGTIIVCDPEPSDPKILFYNRDDRGIWNVSRFISHPLPFEGEKTVGYQGGDNATLIFTGEVSQNRSISLFSSEGLIVEFSNSERYFGSSIDFKKDIIAVGSPGGMDSEGRVHIYSRKESGEWIYVGYLEGSTIGEDFGFSVRLSEDAQLFVGSRGANSSKGLVNIYRLLKDVCGIYGGDNSSCGQNMGNETSFEKNRTESEPKNSSPIEQDNLGNTESTQEINRDVKTSETPHITDSNTENSNNETMSIGNSEQSKENLTTDLGENSSTVSFGVNPSGITRDISTSDNTLVDDINSNNQDLDSSLQLATTSSSETYDFEEYDSSIYTSIKIVESTDQRGSSSNTIVIDTKSEVVIDDTSKNDTLSYISSTSSVSSVEEGTSNDSNSTLSTNGLENTIKTLPNPQSSIEYSDTSTVQKTGSEVNNSTENVSESITSLDTESIPTSSSHFSSSDETSDVTSSSLIITTSNSTDRNSPLSTSTIANQNQIENMDTQINNITSTIIPEIDLSVNQTSSQQSNASCTPTNCVNPPHSSAYCIENQCSFICEEYMTNNGTHCLDCNGSPFEGDLIDSCGICGGNGSTCANTVFPPSIPTECQHTVDQATVYFGPTHESKLQNCDTWCDSEVVCVNSKIGEDIIIGSWTCNVLGYATITNATVSLCETVKVENQEPRKVAEKNVLKAESGSHIYYLHFEERNADYQVGDNTIWFYITSISLGVLGLFIMLVVFVPHNSEDTEERLHLN